MAKCCSSAPRNLVIETTAIRVDGQTGGRCSDTVESARIAARELQVEFEPFNVTVTLIEHDAISDDLSDSNSVVINGRSVEEWIGADRVLTECGPCGDLIGEPVCCGAVSIEGAITESYNVEQIREAALTALNEYSSGCCC